MADITLDNMTTLNADKLSRRFPIIGWHTDQQISWQDKHDKSTWQINVSSAHLSVCQRHDHAPTHHETCRQLRQLLPSAWLCLPPMTQINVSWQRQKSDADRSDESHARLRQRHKTLRRKPCKTEVSQSATQDATTKAIQDPKCRRQRHKTLRRKPCKIRSVAVSDTRRYDESHARSEVSQAATQDATTKAMQDSGRHTRCYGDSQRLHHRQQYHQQTARSSQINTILYTKFQNPEIFSNPYRLQICIFVFYFNAQ